MKKNKGFTIILVMGAMAVLVIITSIIISIGCGEVAQIRVRNDHISAYYIATAGAERMYAIISNKWQSLSTEQWTTLTLPETALMVDGVTAGKFTVAAYRINNPNQFFYIVSTGEVNNRTVTVTVKYGYRIDYVNGKPMVSLGNMSLKGNKVLFWKFMVNADGPIESAGSINPVGNNDPDYAPNNRYVQYTGTVTENSPNITTAPSFWLNDPFDTTGAFANAEISIPPHSDPNFITRGEAETYAAEQEAITPGRGAQVLAAFDANNKYTKTSQDEERVDNKDAFYYYYTGYLDNDPSSPSYDGEKPHLEIGQGETNYVDHNTTYGPFSVGAGKKIVFVDGDVDVIFNAQQYWGSASDLTIVSMNDIAIYQPVNGPDDRLTLIAYNDISTGGINLGDFADVKGNIVMFAAGDFDAVLGGVMNGPIFAGGEISIDTRWLIFYSARDFNMGTDNWANNYPLGLPESYINNSNFKIERGFHMLAEGVGETTQNFNPRWQSRPKN